MLFWRDGFFWRMINNICLDFGLFIRTFVIFRYKVRLLLWLLSYANRMCANTYTNTDHEMGNRYNAQERLAKPSHFPGQPNHLACGTLNIYITYRCEQPHIELLLKYFGSPQLHEPQSVYTTKMHTPNTHHTAELIFAVGANTTDKHSSNQTSLFTMCNFDRWDKYS